VKVGQWHLPLFFTDEHNREGEGDSLTTCGTPMEVARTSPEMGMTKLAMASLVKMRKKS
jgi:hypothetical protein